MKKIKFEIITPEKIIFEDEVEYLGIPAYGGSMGVLPGHTPMVVQIEPGEVIYHSNKNKEYYAVGGGYCEIKNDMVRLFVEEAGLSKAINFEKAKQELDALSAKLNKSSDSKELYKAEAAMKTALMKLKVAGKRRL